MWSASASVRVPCLPGEDPVDDDPLVEVDDRVSPAPLTLTPLRGAGRGCADRGRAEVEEATARRSRPASGPQRSARRSSELHKAASAAVPKVTSIRVGQLIYLWVV